MQIKKKILADFLFTPSERMCLPESADLLDIESDGEDVEIIEYRGYKNILSISCSNYEVCTSYTWLNFRAPNLSVHLFKKHGIQGLSSFIQ